MPTIEQDVRQIRQAVYGREVREAIADGIEKCYDDVSSAKTIADDSSAAATAAAASANTAAAAATTAAQNANDIVLVQADQPTAAGNKLWVKPESDEYQVPTYEEFEDLKSAVEERVVKAPINLIDTTQSVSGYLNYNGNIESGASYKTSDFILVKKGITYKVTPKARFALFFYASNKQVISGTYMNTDTANYTFTPDTNRYVRITYAASIESTVAMQSYSDVAAEKVEEGVSLSNFQICQVTSEINNTIETEHLVSENTVSEIVDDNISQYFTITPSENLFNVNGNLTNGFIQSGGTITTEGSFASYYTSDYILLPAGTYTIGRIPVVATRYPIAIYSTAKSYESYQYSGNSENSVTFTLSAEKYIRFSMAGRTAVMLISGSTMPENYIPYGDTHELNPNVIVPYSGNILFGKKWWACGDSFTEWTTEEFNADDYPNITVVDDRHHYATYPFWIGSRNGMTVHNFAVSGQTMAMPASPGSFTNAFSNNKYKSIPADVDYITLYFGINDSHHRPGSSGGDGEDNEGEIPLGTIDDTTTATFFGAWNVVLEYLITNRPWAKIGIIITNGAETTDYATAEIALAKKWGIPYLDLNGDYKLPLMLRVDGKPDVCATAVNIRKNQQWADVAQGNGHPNVNAHKFESTFIEAWLRSI